MDDSSGRSRRIDLNSDVGEGFGHWALGDDEALLEVVTSANVACGFHAGDPSTIRRVCRLAAARGVAVGAQVSYRDLAGFGRRFVDVPTHELTDEILYQLAALDGIARAEGTRVTYVKPHGALYHAAAARADHAQAVVRAAVAHAGERLTVLGPPGSELLGLAQEAGLATVAEGFTDRAYTRDGGLVPRGTLGAVLTDEAQVVAQAVRLATQGRVRADDGSEVAVPVESLCLHGDTPGAAGLAHAVRAGLQGAGVQIAPFAPPTP